MPVENTFDSIYDFETIFNRRGSSSLKWDNETRITGKQGLLPFWVADMDFVIAPEIIEALSSRMSHKILGYTTRPESLDNALMNWFQKYHKWNIESHQIVEIPGIVPFLHMAVSTLTQQGENVIIQEPVYYPFRDALTRNGRKVAVNPLKRQDNGRWIMDISGLQKIINKTSARMLILCSPHNPVSRVWSREELLELSDVCKSNNVLVISDEIHCDLVHPSSVHTPWLTLPHQRLPSSLSLVSVTKSFNLPGLNSAFAIIPDPELKKRVIKGLTSLGFGSGISAPLSYVAAEAAWSKGRPWLEALLNQIGSNDRLLRTSLKNTLPDIKATSLEGTYLEWLKLPPGSNDEGIIWKKLVDHGIWLSNGKQFGTGGEGHLRMNIACPEKLLKKGLNLLLSALAS